MTTILHLEDDGPLREILKIALCTVDSKVQVEQFITGEDAIAYAQEHMDEIDLFVLDIRVAGKLTGVDVAQKLREMGAKRPIVLTSAYRRPASDVLDDLECKWLAKPWHIVDAHKVILPLAQHHA